MSADHFVTSRTVAALLPEIVLILAASLVYVAGAFKRHRTLWTCVSLGSLALAAFALATSGSSDRLIEATGPVSIDGLAHATRWLGIVCGALFVCVAWHAGSEELATEQLGSILLAVSGVMLAGSARELTLIFLALELISIPSYILLFTGRKDRASAEATAKYFFLSILSSAFLLYGFSFLYGLGKSTYLSDIRAALLSIGPDGDWRTPLVPVAVTLTFIGLGFKMAFVPFHFYAPDVYQGTTNANAALLAVAPKIAGAAVLLRLVVGTLPSNDPFVWRTLAVLAILTMTVGNASALWQSNVRRMLAFSSIAHSGYMLIGVAAAASPAAVESSAGGATGVVFYLVVYSFGTIGAFAALSAMSTPAKETSGVDELAGLNKTEPALAATLAVFLFSLAGIPPLAGFFGKLALFLGSLRASLALEGADGGWFVLLAIVAAINAAVGAAYYLRLIAAMYFQPVDERGLRSQGEPGFGAVVAAAACAVLVIGVGVVPQVQSAVGRAAQRAARSLTPPAADATANDAQVDTNAVATGPR